MRLNQISLRKLPVTRDLLIK